MDVDIKERWGGCKHGARVDKEVVAFATHNASHEVYLDSTLQIKCHAVLHKMRKWITDIWNHSEEENWWMKAENN